MILRRRTGARSAPDRQMSRHPLPPARTRRRGSASWGRRESVVRRYLRPAPAGHTEVHSIGVGSWHETEVGTEGETATIGGTGSKTSRTDSGTWAATRHGSR